MNWDDLKYFLAVCRKGSIRAAALELKVNHATVSRRINKFELLIGERLFERSAKGYLVTRAGKEILEEASNLEERLNTVTRKVAGKNAELSGDIRITVPELLAKDLLMPAIAEFCQLYPLINIEIIESTKPLNLANREADIAFRLCDKPPEYLIGRHLAHIHRACYIAKKHLPMINKQEWLAQQNWLGWSDTQRKPIGKIAQEYPKLTSKHKILSGILQMEACKNGMGIAILPCFCADIEPLIVRIPPYTSEGKYNLWLLSHPDMRKNVKVQTCVRFMTKYINQKKALIEGEEFSTFHS